MAHRPGASRNGSCVCGRHRRRPAPVWHRGHRSAARGAVVEAWDVLASTGMILRPLSWWWWWWYVRHPLDPDARYWHPKAFITSANASTQRSYDGRSLKPLARPQDPPRSESRRRFDRVMHSLTTWDWWRVQIMYFVKSLTVEIGTPLKCMCAPIYWGPLRR